MEPPAVNDNEQLHLVLILMFALGMAVTFPSPAHADGGVYPADGAVMLPAKLEKSALADLVVAGEFDRAIAEADRQIKGRATGELLYLRGMARLGLAEKSRDTGAYKDAGLDFMRVVVYFPSSAQTGPAMVEVGYVHTRLGLGDKARQIYSEAEKMIKVEDHPRYSARLRKLAGG